MRLSVVIPVHDDAAGLARMLESLAGALEGCAADLCEVIVVDDGSPEPLARAPGAGDLPASLPLVWQRSDACGGAGRARNLGLAAAAGSHVLFLDADDTVTPALGALLTDLVHQTFDFALFAHDDSRRTMHGLQGPDEAIDRALWAAIGATEVPTRLDADRTDTICRISNYPWNRVWRHAFLREHAIRHGETPLHNDIEPHWAGFIEAERILCSSRRCVVHTVRPGAGQLTNRTGAERLCVFEALEAVVARLLRAAERAPERASLVGPFLDFALRLLDWVESVLPDEDARRVLRHRAAGLLEALAREAPPELAQRVERALAEEPGLADGFLAWSEGPGAALVR